METIIREMTRDDIDAVANYRLDFLRELSEDDISDELRPSVVKYLNEHIDDGSLMCLVAQRGEKIIAKAIACIYRVIPKERNLTGIAAGIYSVYTLPGYRGQGIMEQLLRQLIVMADDFGVNEIYLTAEAKAIPLYERLGFERQDRDMRLTLL